ncbi:hypothetical protein ACVYWK_003551, partial [Acinetobacter baumannii]
MINSENENIDELENLKSVEVILERLTFHIFEDVMIWSNEGASTAFKRCVKKTIEEFKNGELILTKGYPQLKPFQVDNVLNALNSALNQAQEHQDKLNAEIDSLKAQAVPTWISVEDAWPPTDTMVLICWADAPEVTPEQDYMTIDEDLNSVWANYHNDPPSHWMHFHSVPNVSGAE